MGGIRERRGKERKGAGEGTVVDERRKKGEGSDLERV
jgi:hypothetical protein